MHRQKTGSLWMLILLLLTASQMAWPDHWRGHWDARHYDHQYWRTGHWVNGWHAGRAGWWWVLGGTWLLYDTVVYPYPSQQLVPAYIVEEPVQAPTPVPPPPQALTPPSAMAPAVVNSGPQVWYHCRNPQGYYPYVTSCPSGWQTVPAVPADLHH